jgi:glutaredoxin
MERFLQEKNIPYILYDIEKDESAASVYHSLGGRGVPVVRVGEQVVFGYNPEAVMALVKGGN